MKAVLEMRGIEIILRSCQSMKKHRQGRIVVYKSHFLLLEVRVDAEDMNIFEIEPLCLM